MPSTRKQTLRSEPSRAVLDWLLEPSQPSIEYLTLRHLLDRPETDSEVIAAKRRIAEEGWAADLLAERLEGGSWVDPNQLYQPKYVSTNWKLLILSDLGLSREIPAIRESCELWMQRFSKVDGGFGSDGSSGSHLCVVGNTARALLKFGYSDEPRVTTAMEWLATHASKNGGWSCWGSGRNLDSWEGLSAFAHYPTARWTPSMHLAVGKAAEFYLDRELHRQGDRYEPWYRFHYPIHYYYDLLVGLDLLTSLGYGADHRLRFALGILLKKRRRDGRWMLDAVHPDIEGPIAEWYQAHPKRRPVPFALESVGQPSKMITLTAYRILSRIDQPRP